MVKINTGGKIDYKKIQNCIRKDTILIGFPEGIPHNKSNTNLDKIAEYLSGEEKKKWMPFLEDGLLANKEELRKEIKEQEEKMITGKAPNLHKIGAMGVSKVKDFVRSGSTGYTISEKTKRAKTSKAGRKKAIN